MTTPIKAMIPESRIPSDPWTVEIYQASGSPPGPEVLQALRDGRIGVVVLKNALDPIALAALQRNIETLRPEARVKQYANSSLTTFGPYLAAHLADPSSYFAAAAETDRLFPDPALDLRADVRETLRMAFGLRTLDVAREPDGRRYAPAVVRLHADGVANPLHNDLIMRDAIGSGLVLAGLSCQFSCVVCVQECSEGGRLHHYRKPWDPKDERFKVPGNLGYDEAVLSGADHLVFRPEIGDVYVMNPTLYHSIDRVSGIERRTMGFFFGFLESGSLRDALAWS